MHFNGRIGRGVGPVPSPGRGLVAGLIGGLAGSLAMAAFQAAWARAVDPALKPAEHDVAGDAAGDSGREPSTLQAARGLARTFAGLGIPEAHEAAASRAFHFAFGAGLGGLYGVLVEYVGLASIGRGIPFGMAQVLVADELAVPALGLAGTPSRAPAAAHLRSFGAHAVYGLTTDLVRRAALARI